MNKKILLKLSLIFIGIAAIKVILSFFMNGPYIFSDEPCAIQRAVYFANNFKLESCANILELGSKSPHPLYSIFIAPIYLLTGGTTAYYIVLALNSLLVSSLIYPLFSIFNKFLKNDKLAIFGSIIILFLPQIVVYEKMVMTESIFAVISIWFLHFYINSFDNNKKSKRNKLLSVILGIMAALSRPFGFIFPIAIAINEFFLSQNRKMVALIYLPLAAILTAITLTILTPEAVTTFDTNVALIDKELLASFVVVLQAIKSQINSFTLATLLIPTIIFFTYIFKKDSKDLNNIKIFLLSIIILNFLISTNHIHSYFVQGLHPGMLTRYINISLIFIFIFAFIFIFKYKKFEFNKSNITIIAISVIALTIPEISHIKHTLNLDLSTFYDTTTSTKDNLVTLNRTLILPIVGITALMAGLTLKNKKKWLSGTLAAVLLAQGIYLYAWNINFSSFTSETVDYFRDTEESILFLGNQTDINPISFNYWKLLVLSENNINFKYFMGAKYSNTPLTLTPEELNLLQNEYTYIVSRYKLDLPIIKTISPLGTGSVESLNEYIYKL